MRFDVLRLPVIVLTALCFSLLGCDPSENGIGTQTAAVEGRVDDDAGSDGTGADDSPWLVTAYRVDAEGHLTAAGGPVETGADGRFTLDVDLAAEVHDGSLVLRAEHATRGEASVLMDGPVREGDRREAQPIDARTSVSVRIYLDARASGTWPSRCTSADLRAMISAEAAAAYGNDGPSETDARAFAAALHAWSAALVEAGGEAAFAAFREARIAARTTLDAALYAASTEAERAEAFAAYADAEAAAYADAGFAPEDVTLAVQAQLEAYVAAGVDLSAEAHAILVADLEAVRAALVSELVRHWVTLTGAGEDAMGEIAEAQLTLEAALAASAEAGAQGRDDARDAWAAFRASVRATVESRADATRAQAYGVVIESLDAARAGLKTALEEARDAAPSASASLVVTAMVEYQDQATAQAHVETLVTVGSADAVTARAAVEALAALWAAGC